MELFISNDWYEIPIPLPIRNDSLSFNYENFIGWYYVYMKVWSPLFSECLFGRKEPINRVDKNAVAVIHLHSCSREEVVGNVPQNNSRLVPLYLSLPHFYLELEVTEKRVNREGRYGLEIPASFCFNGPEKPRSGWKQD